MRWQIITKQKVCIFVQKNIYIIIVKIVQSIKKLKTQTIDYVTLKTTVPIV